MNLYVKLSLSVILFFATALIVDLYAQRVQINTRFAVPGRGVPQDSIPSISRKLQSALDDYIKFGSLFDESQQMVSEDAIYNFKSLFNLSADILNELEETPSMINASDYASLVYSKFPKQGVRCQIKSALLDEIRFDSAGYYLASVLVEKRVFNLIREKNGLGTFTQSGRCFTEKIRFDVAVDFDRVRIQQIVATQNPSCPPLPGEKEVLAGLEMRLGGAFMNFSSRSFLDDKSSTIYGGNLALTGGVDVGLGARLQYPLGKQKKLFLLLNAGYYRTGMQASFDSVHYRFQTSDIDNDLYVHDVQLSDLSENINISGFEVNPGFSILMAEAPKIKFMADVQLLMRMTSAKGELNGNASYRGIYDSCEWIAYNEIFREAYGFSDYTPNNLQVKYDRVFSAGLRLSPNIQFRHKKDLIFHAGLEYDFLFGAPLPLNPDDQHILRFRGQQEYSQEGIGFNYIDKIRYSSVRFRIGFMIPIKKIVKF
jgi:hypothetical protein